MRSRAEQRLAEYIFALVRLHEQRELTHEKQILKQALARCGNGVRINGRITLWGADSAKLGDNVHLNDNSFIDARAGLTIGDNTHIGRNLVLFTTNHNYHGVCLPYDNTLLERPVWIGRNVWIGMNVCIVPGARIGDGAIVGMGTTVHGDVPEMAIIGASGWQVLGQRESRHYELLELEKRYGGFDGRPLWWDQEA